MRAAAALRCLLVDDSPGFLAAATELLERQGLLVVGTAGSSAEALTRAAAVRPDVTLVDIELGPESGLVLARELADGGAAGHVVLTSAMRADDAADLLDGTPAVGFVPKEALSAEAVLRAVLAIGRPGQCDSR